MSDTSPGSSSRSAGAIKLRPAEHAQLVLVGIVNGAASFALVLGVRRAVGHLAVTTTRQGAIVPSLLLVTAAVLALALAKGFDYAVAEQIGYRHVGRLRIALYDKLTRLPLRTVSRMSKGAILLRLTGDLSMLRTWISRGFCRAIVAAITLLAVAAALAAVGFEYLGAVTGVVLALFAWSMLLGYRVRRATRNLRWRRSLLTSNIAEQISALATVRAFGRGPGERQRLIDQNREVVDSLVRAARARGRLRALSTLASSAGLPVVLAIATLELPRGRTTVADAVAAITAARLLSSPLRTLGRSYEYRQAASVSKHKLVDFLSRREDLDDGDRSFEVRVRKGRVELFGVSVDGALDDVSFAAEPGRITAIVGANGAGKSTLLSVVARLMTPDRGRIEIDAQDVATATRRSLARQTSIVSTETPLLRGTLRRNLTYRNRLASDAEVRRVASLCRVDEIPPRHGAGLDMWLEEGGRNLSAGERQRVMLARAMLDNPRLLLLDEPTVHLDPSTCEVFRRAVAHYGGTVIWATNDPVEASLADKVVALDAGRVVEVLDGPAYRDRAARRVQIDAGRPRW